MNDETKAVLAKALARLREKRARCDKFRASSIDVEADDLRALLDAYDTACAEGFAAERARVVAAVKKRAWMLPKVERQALLIVAERLERGLHDKEGT